jgi:hypothetical protein
MSRDASTNAPPWRGRLAIARNPQAAELLEERLFDPDIARAKRGEPPSASRERLASWLWDKLAFFL